ncbi:MAG: AtpZ/AtpI family protein [Bacteroidota bacterium]|jgi:ATP synthase protein I
MSDPPKDQNPGRGELTPEERAAFERRVRGLESELGKAKAAHKPGPQGGDALRGRGMAYGFRMSSELVAAILVGGIIGYVLDRWLGTTPWLFLVFFVLGFAAGILNLLRAYRQMQNEIAASTGGNLGRSIPDDDD